MIRRLVAITLILVAALVPTTALAQARPGSRVVSTFTLPDTPLGAVQNAKLAGSISNDRKFLLGGIGSDLWRSSTDPAGEYWMITDRGPNDQIRVDNANRRTFPVPEFTPHILRVRTEGTAIRVIDSLPIVGQSGKPITGLSNLTRIDETPYDFAASGTFPFNPNGLDSEGLVRTSAGDFWVADEYSPSIIKIDRTGKVVKRYVPDGFALPGTDYPVATGLPAIHAKRKINRGYEGIAISADERTLYIALQSPLLNPNAATGNASRVTRIVAFDIASEKAVAEYAYRFDLATSGYGSKQTPDEMKLSGIVVTGPTTMLILERTDEVAKIYAVDTRGATNLLGSKWNDLATTPTLESNADPAALGVTALLKTLVVDLSTLQGVPGKVEGIAIVNDTTIAIANDNDFDIGKLDAAGNLIAPGATKSQLLLVQVQSLLPSPATQLPRTGSPSDALPLLGMLAVAMLVAGRAVQLARLPR